MLLEFGCKGAQEALGRVLMYGKLLSLECLTAETEVMVVTFTLSLLER